MITAFRNPLCRQFSRVVLVAFGLLLLTKSRALIAATPGIAPGTTLLAADRGDLSLDTGLWRSEFLKTPEAETPTDSGSDDNDNHRSLQALRSLEVRNGSDTVNLEQVTEEYFADCEALSYESTVEETIYTDEVPEHLSDWEQAICNVSDGKALATGQKGPSMITVIVAVVGVVVVIGAYMKK